MREFLFADIAGLTLLIKILNGDFMESFSLNSAKSYLGKNVNLHLKDGSVIINVHLTNVKKGAFGKKNLLEFMPYRNRKLTAIPLRNIAWAELLNLNLMRFVQ